MNCKIKIFVCLIILCFVFFVLGELCYWNKDKHPTMLVAGYYKKEFYKSTDEVTSFVKYYYKESVDINKKYVLGEDNVDVVKDNIKAAISKLYELDNSINIKFNYDDITSNDYYLLVNDLDFICFEYYDVEEYVLYEVYLSK